MKFNENTCSYYSSQELYFSTKIKFNILSVIILFFDFLGENKNKYNLIKIYGYKTDKNLINHEAMEIVADHDVLNNNKLLWTIFILIKNDNSLEQSNILQNKIIEKSHNNLVLICIIVNYTNKHKIYGIFNFG